MTQPDDALRDRLTAWIDQYDDEPTIGATVARLTLRHYLPLILTRPNGVDLAESGADLFRAVQILQAFGGYLAVLEQARKDGLA